MSTVLYRRPGRRQPPAMPKGEVLFEAPPELPEATPGGAMQKMFGILPMLGGGAVMAFMLSSGSTGNNSMRLLMSGTMAVSMVGMYISQLGSGGKNGERKHQVDGSRRDYLRYLGQLRRRVRTAANRQREALEWRYPEPDSLWVLPLSRRLWERRPADRDFGHVRVAKGVQRFVLQLIAPETKPVEDLEPVAAGALRRFIATYRTVPDVPIAVSLRGFAHVRMDGDPQAVRGLNRAMVAHLAAFHAPHEFVVASCLSPDRRAEWDWLKWLPHALHPTATDGAGQVRLVTSSLAELERLLAPELANRPFFSANGKPLTDQPHVVVLVDGGHASTDSRFLSAPPQGVTVIDLTGNAVRRFGDGVMRLRVTADQVFHVATGSDDDPDEGGKESLLGRPDELTVAQAESFARQLAPLRSALVGPTGVIEEQAEVEEEKPQYELELMSLLGIPDAHHLDPDVIWQPRPRRDRLRIPFGLTPDGRPVELDIKESAQGGMGPHGLVIGATGSGKSEVLRTFVLGLAVTHSPDALNLVLVDFKGGATFLGLDSLPHVSAVITNLEDELILVDRMQDALAGEMNRRQEVLRQAGNYGSLRDYEDDRAKGKPLEPMPSLWIVVDEFSELLSAKPEFIELFVMIGRLGRSLGVHLLLASQRLEEGKLRGLDTHLSYRIGLRTFSAGESRVVLGVPDAYELPREPGGGYLKVGTEGLVRFKAAYVGGVYEPSALAAGPGRKPPPKPGEKRWVPRITAYTTDYVEPEIVQVPEEPEPEPAETPAYAQQDRPQPRVLVDLVVDQLKSMGRAAHQVWLPPLDTPPTLDSLLPGPLTVIPDNGLTVDWEGRGQLRAPVAIVDKPYYQRRDPMWLDLAGAGGHVGIVGGPQSGKSTLLRSLIASYSLTHRPDEVQFYCLDFGGGTLSALLGLPHVGGVATRLDADAIRRTVGELTTLLEQRERAFTDAGVDSIATYRRMRRQGRIQPDRFASDVFLVVDGWGTVRADHEAVESAVTTLAARGLGFGIHVVATANKWSEFRMAIKDLIQTRLELKVGDPYDSEIDRRAAANVPANRPGRGLSPEQLHFLGALPRIDGVEDAEDVAEGVQAMVAAVADAWQGPAAPPVRLLPEELPLQSLPQAGTDPRPGVPIGIDEDELAPVYLNLDEEPHLVVFGANECGKSNLLEVIARGIVDRHPPSEARLIIVDYRRALLDAVSGDHLIGFAASSDAATSLLKDVGAALRKRLPGPDVTSEQLRNRTWWKGSDLYLIVDDYELVATSSGNPLAPITDLVSQARDIGLHLIIARGFGGAGRAMYDPIVQRIRDMGNPGLIMSGTREEGQLWGGVRGAPLPPGRGTLVSRRLGTRLIQTAYVKGSTDQPLP
ncbi:type VII secretion protein EccCa [Actinopolymorpha singaporensis]|uniref:DNA segregation ATPase FtsK/SpoIIIE, S-DNA-T family n=1 Tax=Actinopolymorpha singaporensis TaxID=117157 RepID=A0A1H1NH79_9ACTN|nr:type VII secretion protein EccCa [Actinopolymorpha singaporensis]SDR98105.1 DNA segregation ATPase FtsK/SpoIIIE, S-DNA-T family [Actinopolymorpha singaporensis]